VDFKPALLGWIHPRVLVFGYVSLLAPVHCGGGQHLDPSKNAHPLSKMNSLSASARLPSFEPIIERARHAHALVRVQHIVIGFVFIVAFFQRVQVPIFLDVPKYGVHHHAGFVIRDVRNHCFVRDKIIIAVQHVIDVVLNVRLYDECAK
jgi:hypothetical protein